MDLVGQALAFLVRCCVGRGTRGRKYWHPSEAMLTSTTRAALWAALVHELAVDSRFARDALVVVNAADPESARFEAGLELHKRLFGSTESARMRTRAIDRLRSSKRLTGQLPPRFARLDASGRSGLCFGLQIFDVTF